jgi:hypothetical protein
MLDRMTRVALMMALLAVPAVAHVPVIDTASKTVEAPYLIDDAEHSKAIYAILDGDADYYRIDEATPFDFYVGLTAPKLEACDLQATFSFEVLNAEMEIIDSRDGTDFTWRPWFEKYGGQWYWVGPEIGEDFSSTTLYLAGTYYIRVFNDENQGKYVLAIGDVERFGLRALLTLPKTIQQIAVDFWDAQDCP